MNPWRMSWTSHSPAARPVTSTTPASFVSSGGGPPERSASASCTMTLTSGTGCPASSATVTRNAWSPLQSWAAATTGRAASSAARVNGRRRALIQAPPAVSRSSPEACRAAGAGPATYPSSG